MESDLWWLAWRLEKDLGKTELAFGDDRSGTFVYGTSKRLIKVNDGDTVELSVFVPAIRCDEFLLSCIRQFNLYVGEIVADALEAAVDTVEKKK